MVNKYFSKVYLKFFSDLVFFTLWILLSLAREKQPQTEV